MNFINIDAHRALSDLEDPARGIALKRNAAIDLVTALIDFLDDTEGDCDLEDNADAEPSLCGQPVNEQYDLELDTCDDEDSDPAGGDILDEPHDGDEDAEFDFRHHGEIGRRAMRKLATRRAGEPVGDEVKRHQLNVSAFPERYALHVVGDCLDPEIADGSRVEVSTTERPMPGDFVIIHRYPVCVRPGEWQCVCKQLVIDNRGPRSELGLPGVPGGLGVMADMLNPPRRMVYPAHEIEAVHKVIRVIPEAEYCPKLSIAEQQAMGLR